MAIKDTDLEVVDLKNGLWVRKVVLLQIGIKASSRRAEVRDAGRCIEIERERGQLHANLFLVIRLSEE